MKENLTHCAAAAALLFLFPPIQSYLPQPEEFHIGLREVCVFSFGAFLVALAILSSFTLLLKRYFSGRDQDFLAILRCLTTAIFIQQYFFIWKYGPLGTRDIFWSSYFYGYVDTPLWLLCFFIGWKYRNIFASFYPRIAIVFLTYSTFILCFTYLQNQGHPSYASAMRREDTIELRNTFSKGKNVILIVLDGFQGSAFQELIDERKELKQDFSDFTYYRNATSAYGFTQQSSANFLSGEFWDGKSSWDTFPQELVSKRSLARDLKQKGVLVELVHDYNVFFTLMDASDLRPRPKKHPILWFRVKMERMAYVYDFALFKIVPHYLKRYVMNDLDWLLSSRATRYTQRVDDLKKLVRIRDEQDLHELRRHNRDDDMYFFASLDFPTTTTEQNVFKYYHTLGPHFPLVLNENLEIYKAVDDREMPGVKKMYLNQAHAYLKLVLKSIFNKLKDANLWDNTMVILIGDHGGGLVSLLDTKVPPGKFPYQYDKAQANPLFLLKPFHAKGPLKTLDVPVVLGDIPKTVLTALNLPADDYQGMDVLSLPEGFSRKRYFSTINFQEKEGPKKLSLWGGLPIYEYEIDGFCWDDRAWKVNKVIR